MIKNFKIFEEEKLDKLIKDLKKDDIYDKYKYKYLIVKVHDFVAQKEVLLLTKFIDVFLGEVFFEIYSKNNKGEYNYYGYEAKINKTKIIEVFDDFNTAKEKYELMLIANKYNI